MITPFTCVRCGEDFTTPGEWTEAWIAAKEEKITGRPVAGDWTISYGGESATYNRGNKLISVSNPGVDWALRWTNEPVTD